MGTGLSVGSVTVDVVPDATGWEKNLNNQLKNAKVKIQAVLDDNGVQQQVRDIAKDTTAKVKVETTGTKEAAAAVASVAKDHTAQIKVEADTTKASAEVAKVAQKRIARIDVEAFGLDKTALRITDVVTRARANNRKASSADLEEELRAIRKAYDNTRENLGEARVKLQFDEIAAQAEYDKVVEKLSGRRVKLSLDQTEFRQRLANISKEIADTKAEIELDPDDKGLQAKLKELQREKRTISIDASVNLNEGRKDIAELKGETVTLRAEFERGMATARAQIRELENRRIELKADLDTKAAELKLARLEDKAKKDKNKDALNVLAGSASLTTGLLAGLIAVGVSIGPAIVPAAAAAAAAILALGPAAITATASIGVLIAGLKNVFAAVGASQKAQEAVGKNAKNLADQQAAAASRIAAAQDGVKNAEAGLANARANAAQAAKEASRAVLNAESGVTQAREAAAEAARRSAKAVIDAQLGVKQATIDAARSVENAIQRQVQAQRTLENAILSERRAQQSLSDARKQAVRDIEDLNRALTGGQLDERQAALDVQNAYNELIAAQDSGSLLEREQAQLNYDRANQKQKDLVEEQKRLKEQQKTSNAQGVEGSPQVTQAKQQLADAKAAVEEAKRGAIEATKAIAEARTAGNQAIADAEAKLSEAERARTIQRKESAESIRKAETDLVLAREAQAEQARKSAYSVAQAQQSVVSAQRSLADAQRASKTDVDGSTAALDAQREAMAKLSPEGRALVLFLTNKLIPAYDEFIKRNVEPPIARGLLGFFKAAEPVLKPLKDLFSGLATALGDLFIQAGEALGSPFWVDFFKMLAKQAPGALKSFGTFIGDILTGFAGILTALQPFAEDIGKFFLDLSGKFRDFGTGKSGGLGAFVDYIKVAGPEIARVISNILGAFGKVIIALAPIGEQVLGILDQVATKIKDIPTDQLTTILGTIITVIASLAGLTAIISIVTAVAGAFTFLTSVVGAIIGGLALLAIGFIILYQKSEPFRKFVDEKLIPALKSAADDALAGFRRGLGFIQDVIKKNQPTLDSMYEFFKKLAGYIVKYIIPIFGTSLGLAFLAIGSIIATFIQIITNLYGMWETNYKVFKRVTKTLTDLIGDMWTKYVQPVLEEFKFFIEQTLPEAFDTGVQLIKAAWELLKEITKAPIRFMVDTVIDDGLLGAFRAISNLVGFDKGKDFHVELPKGFARGGWTGPGNKYDVAGVVHADEFVINKESRRKIELMAPGYLDQLNGYAKGGKVVWPGNTKVLSDNYNGHSGIDIRAAQGTPIYAATDGTINYTGYGRGYGNAIFEQAVNGLNMVYGHASKVFAKVGQLVKAGDHIGAVGATGNASGPHIHFEIAPSGRFDLESNRAATLAYLGGSGINPSGTEAGADRGFFAPITDWFAKLKDRFAGPMNKLKSLGDSPFVQAASGIPKLLANAMLAKGRDFTAAESNQQGAGPTSNYVAKGGEPMQNAAVIASVGSGMGRRAQIIGIATAIVESGLRNLNYGDRDSVGLFQQRAPWGSFAARTNPRTSAGMFFHGGRGGQRGLDDIPNWQSLPMGQAAQAVQVSAFPGRYAQVIGQATGILDSLKKSKKGDGPSLVGNTRIPSIYDEGGWLKPGTTIVHNATGKPEPVFNPGQWKTLEAMLANGSTSGRPTVNVEKIETTDARAVAAAIQSQILLQEALYPTW